MSHSKALFLVASVLAFVSACGGSERPRPAADAGVNPAPKPGETTFTSRAPAGYSGSNFGRDAATGAVPPEAAPSGRTGPVEEGDIYKVEAARLYYFNTYRGFVTYDLSDPKNPARLGRLAVFGYPVEMFVEGSTVFALVRQALTLSSSPGELRFERREVSQLLSIDVSDPKKPRVQKAIDIAGDLREGVSRRIGNTLYVVSYLRRGYWYGGVRGTVSDKDQASVHSFDLSSPANPVLVKTLPIFAGGSVQTYDPSTGSTFTRSFRDVAISATANALMVVENWDIWSYVNGGQRCGNSSSNQHAISHSSTSAIPRATFVCTRVSRPPAA